MLPGNLLQKDETTKEKLLCCIVDVRKENEVTLCSKTKGSTASDGRDIDAYLLMSDWSKSLQDKIAKYYDLKLSFFKGY